MTPILIASKFGRRDVENRLVDFGASLFVRDFKGNTVLHYMSVHKYCDKRFFIYNEDTFGSYTGMSHFHIACMFCPATIDVVNKYLEIGISPNLEIKESEIDIHPVQTGHTGLHMAAFLLNGDRGASPALARLLLEYGADVEKRDSKNETVFDLVMCVDDYTFATTNDMELVCVLIEAGVSVRDSSMAEFMEELELDNEILENVTMFLHCVIKMMLLKGTKFRSRKLRRYYNSILDNYDGGAYFEYLFEDDCEEELEELSKIGLDRILRDSLIRSDFKQKWDDLVGSPDLPKEYPIYGNLLKIKMRNQLFCFKEKKEKIKKMASLLIIVVKNICNLPVICAEEILWNFEIGKLDKLRNTLKLSLK